jgi:hypothetical protein
MTVRFCPTCSSDVEVADGFCLLGHSVRLEAQMDQSLSQLRAEVDKAFDEARIVVTSTMGPPPPPPPPTGIAPSSPALIRRTSEPGAVAVASAPASAPWAPLFTEPSLAGTDPIEAFAPPPRVDWGPERIKGFKRRAAR